MTDRIVLSGGAMGPVRSLELLKAGTRTVAEIGTVGDASAWPSYESRVAIRVAYVGVSQICAEWIEQDQGRVETQPGAVTDDLSGLRVRQHD